MTNTETTTLPAKEATLSALRIPRDDIKNLPVVNIGFGNLQSFELTQRAAKLLASSSLVPKEYNGNIANCTIALNMAARIGADPLMVMQNLVIVHGRPTWSSQFLIATVNSCGRFSALRYEFFGQPNTDTWGCRAWAIEKCTGEKLVGTDITIKIAKDEGWYGKNGSKWKTIPQQMLMYRAGSWWTRAYAPELSMGLMTTDEVRDVIDAEKMDDGSYTVDLGQLRTENTEGNKEIIEQNAEAATSTPPWSLQDYLDDIAASPTLEGLEHKFTQAAEVFKDDLDAAAALMLAKQTREKALKAAKPRTLGEKLKEGAQAA